MGEEQALKPSNATYGGLIDSLRANSVRGVQREELLTEMGVLRKLGAPDKLVRAILQWNDLMGAAAEALVALSEQPRVPPLTGPQDHATVIERCAYLLRHAGHGDYADAVKAVYAALSEIGAPTPMSVTRYGLRCGTWEMVPDSSGKWVAFGDYEALEKLYIEQTGCCK